MPSTVAIIDLAHCGTTMLAGVCEILGVPMVGARYKERKWEDQDVIAAIRDRTAFAQLVARRDAAHERWGFKFAGAWLFADSLVVLRDPVYLAIYKDPVSVTARRFNAVTISKLANTLRQMRDSVHGINDAGLDVRWLSYHQAVVTPAAFVVEVAHAIDIPPTPAQVDRAVAFIRPNRGGPLAPYPEVAKWLT